MEISHDMCHCFLLKKNPRSLKIEFIYLYTITHEEMWIKSLFIWSKHIENNYENVFHI